MPLINWEVELVLTWSKECVATNSTDAGKFAITETKLYVPVVTLSTEDNAKLLQKLKSGFMIEGKNVFDQPINSKFKTYENIQKIATGQGDDYKTGCLLDCSYFKDHCKMIAID